MVVREPEAEPHFTLPLRQVLSMLIAMGLIGAGGYFGFETLLSIFQSNLYLNGLILVVFIIGVLSCFQQILQVMGSVRWIEGFAQQVLGHEMVKVPALLAPLATLLRARGRMHLSASSSRSILDSVGSRIDEDREITRYLGNTLIFLGLLGTFYGLATTVPALVETIRSLNPDEADSGSVVFERLQAGLESQLGGMGTAFSSSLLGLAGSLVVGLLELFASHGQNRFYRELEEWLSSITRVGFSTGDEGHEGDGAPMMSGVVEHLNEQIEALQLMFTQTDIARSGVEERLDQVAAVMEKLADSIGASTDAALPAALARVAEGQEELIAKLRENGMDGIDAESRMRLRSIDVQMLRILEELSAGRQETVSELRNELSALTRSLRQARTSSKAGLGDSGLEG
ncbi:MAG: biopolymer transporter ExbB [Marivivens sp.]|nr:biopolymer transporter ExbB [Marivivens sp.]